MIGVIASSRGDRRRGWDYPDLAFYQQFCNYFLQTTHHYLIKMAQIIGSFSLFINDLVRKRMGTVSLGK